MGKERRGLYLLLVVSALGLALGFAPFNLGFLAFFSFIPLFILLEKASPKRAFFISWLFGFLFFLFVLWWLVFLDFPLPKGLRFLLWIGVFILFVYLGVFYGIFGYLTKKISLWAAPFLIAGIEYIRELTDLGFPWGCVGYTQVKYPVFFQIASIFGVQGVSSWVVLVNILIYKLFRTKNYKKWGVLVGICFAVPLIYGGIRLTIPLEEKMKAGIVQPNIPGNLKGTKRVYDSLTQEMFSQCRKLKELHLIVFPETGTLVDLTRNKVYKKRYISLCRELNTAIIAGMPYWRYEDHKFVFYNSAVMIKKNGISKIYKKIRLAPFGEMIPFENKIPFLKEIDVGGGHFGRGRKYVLFEHEGVRFGVLICFESIFPELSRNFVKNGADVLVNITNDGWFRKTPGPYQHAEMMVARAVENGVSVIRAANNGVSFFVSPKGIVENPTGLFVKEEAKGVVYKKIKTFYTPFGHFYPKVLGWCVIFTLLFFISERWRKRSTRKKRR